MTIDNTEKEIVEIIEENKKYIDIFEKNLKEKKINCQDNKNASGKYRFFSERVCC